jgi:hypothetical protein
MVLDVKKKLGQTVANSVYFMTRITLKTINVEEKVIESISENNPSSF